MQQPSVSQENNLSDSIAVRDSDESFDLTLLNGEETSLILSSLSPCHVPMVRDIVESLPAIRRDTDVFGRTQSQFMDRNLTCTHPTGIRNIRQMLAEINKAWSALREAWYNIQIKEVDAQIKEDEAIKEDNPLIKKRLMLEAAKLRSEIQAANHPISGAIRKIRALTSQIESVKKKLGKDHITEADFEADEARYHVMRAFDQALCAARSRGRIDEGNHIYLNQIGVNGMIAQMEIDHRLEQEKQIIAAKQVPDPQAHQNWLERMADKYSLLSTKLASVRGFLESPVQQALLVETVPDEPEVD